MLLISKKRYKKRSSTRTTDQFIELARKVHGDTYLYDKAVYDTCNSKITIICRKHGEFEQLSKNHLKGVGCHLCKNERQTIFTAEILIDRARKIHGNEYSYDKVVCNGNRSIITITCHEHGDFEQIVYNHLRGSGCPKCVSKRKSRMANKWLDSINIAEEYRELKLKENIRRPVDAYVAETNTVYQFHGDYWHGNPKIYNTNEFNTLAKKSMGELYERTLKWDQQIRDLGYNLVVMWESDFKKQYNN